MIKRNKFVERRKAIRYRLKHEVRVEFYKTYPFNLRKPRFFKAIPIYDICLGGLGFLYTSRNMWPTDFDTFTLAAGSNENRIESVPYKIVTDFPLSKLKNSKSVRRCGVKFGDLSTNQKFDLSVLIRKHSNPKKIVDRRTAKNQKMI